MTKGNLSFENNVPAKKTSAAEELNSILNELNSADLANLPQEEIIKLKKKLNPYGRTIEGSNNYLNFSITLIQQEYWKNFVVTSFVAFLNRMVDEWEVPEGLPVVSVYEYLKDKTKLDTPQGVLEKNDKSAIYDYEFNRKWMEKRVIVKGFLEKYLQFNPDEHVRSAHRPNRADDTRSPVETMAGRLAVEHLMATDKDFKAREELYLEAMEAKRVAEEKKQVETKKPAATKQIRKVITDKNGKKMTITKEVPVSELEAKDADKSIVNNNMKDPTVANGAREMIPPHDTFGNFKTYMSSNFEELRDATNDLYCMKSEYELAINPYSWHDNPEQAEAFKKKHQKEVIAEVFTAHSGKWNFFDSFKEQRENVNFYNENTTILEEMVKQQEKDERLGQDLMKKRIEKAKRKNIIQSGPDAESFKKWRAQNNVLKNLGASHIGDQADPECPTDGIQVDVWKVSATSMEVTKEKFYTLAEAPTFVKEAQDRSTVEDSSLASPAQPPGLSK